MNETIAQKLQYTSDAVDDIQAAINEKGVNVDNTVELCLYGDKIREINSDESSEIKVSSEADNALLVKEDGLFLQDLNPALDEIYNILGITEIGCATGKLPSYEIPMKNNISENIVIPLNLDFTPSAVFLEISNMSAGTNSTVHQYAKDVWISSLYTENLTLSHDTNVNSSTSFTWRGIKTEIQNFSKESITLHVKTHINTTGSAKIDSVYGNFILYGYWYAIA